MQTIQLTDSLTGATSTARLTKQFIAGLPDEFTAAPSVLNAIQIYADSADPTYQPPALPLRALIFSGYDATGVEYYELETLGGQGSEWEVFGAFQPDAVQIVSLENKTAVRAVAVNIVGRTPSAETPLP